jgi:thioredoxin 1
MKVLKAALSIAAVTLTQQVLACPGCKDALSNNNTVANPWSTAYNSSIMFMLGTVLVIIVSVTYGIFRIVRAEERRKRDSEAGIAAAPVAAPQRKLSLWKFVLPAVAVMYVAFISSAMSRTAAMQSTVIDIPSLNDSTFRSASLVNKAMVVDFGASWCPICQKTGPEFYRVAVAKRPLATFFQMDVDHSPATARALKVDELPCIVLFSNGEEVARHTGAATEAELTEWIDKNTPK